MNIEVDDLLNSWPEAYGGETIDENVLNKWKALKKLTVADFQKYMDKIDPHFSVADAEANEWHKYLYEKGLKKKDSDHWNGVTREVYGSSISEKTKKNGTLHGL